MKAFVLALLLAASGCTWSVAGDAAEACQRINAAVHAFEKRCGVPYAGELQDCSVVIGSDGTGTEALECEQTLAARTCEDLELLPKPCRLAYLERPH